MAAKTYGTDKPLSQSQKIRHILYRLWEKDSEGVEFEVYYKDKTGKYIEFLMKKLDDTPLPENP